MPDGGFTSLIPGFLNLLAKLSADRQAHAENTLIAISEAFHATEAYYTFLTTNPRNQERESALAQKWEKASILIKRYDNDLSRRLNLKSNFWRNQDTWTGDDVAAAGIGLRWVKMEADDLLKKSLG